MPCCKAWPDRTIIKDDKLSQSVSSGYLFFVVEVVLHTGKKRKGSYGILWNKTFVKMGYIPIPL
jgi:hypothetical protein